jgi:hypothetical protein
LIQTTESPQREQTEALAFGKRAKERETTMGEYATTRRPDGTIDTLCKVGTCDDWRYVRRAEAERLAVGDAGQGTDFPTALAEAGILYRFPWPWEDGEEHAVDLIAKRDMFKTYTFALPGAGFMADFIDHEDYVVHKDAGTLVMACPLSPAFLAAGLNTRDVPAIVNVYGERYAAGTARTIFRCGFCQRPFSVPASRLDIFREAAQNTAIADRFRDRDAHY